MNNSTGPQGDQAGQGNSLLSSYTAWAAGIPWVTRISLITISVLSILSLIGMDFTLYLSNMPYFTLYNFEIYRILLSIFVDNSIISTVFMWLFFPAMGKKMECTLGSTGFLILLYSTAIATNLIFIVLCLVFAWVLGMPEAMMWSCSGFWIPLFTLITLGKHTLSSSLCFYTIIY